MKLRLSNVYRRRGLLLISASSRTASGFWVDSPPRLRLEAGAIPEDVGAAVAQALAGSAEGLPDPPVRGPLPIQPLLELAGVKSWSTFVKGAILVSVEQEDDRVTILPQRNGGARAGFVPLEEVSPPQAPAGDIAELGRQVLIGLDLAE